MTTQTTRRTYTPTSLLALPRGSWRNALGWVSTLEGGPAIPPFTSDSLLLEIRALKLPEGGLVAGKWVDVFPDCELTVRDGIGVWTPSVDLLDVADCAISGSLLLPFGTKAPSVIRIRPKKKLTELPVLAYAGVLS